MLTPLSCHEAQGHPALKEQEFRQVCSHFKRVAATLLYSKLPVVRNTALLSFVNATRAPDQAPFRESEGQSGLTNGNLRIQVTAQAKPLPRAMFQSALDASLTRIKAHDYRGTIADHGAALTIAVTSLAQDGRAQQDRAALVSRIIACQRAVLGGMRQARPDLVHWQQSDMVFTADEVEATAAMDFPVTLVSRPGIYAGGRDPMGRERFGLRVFGAEPFLGKPLLFAVVARPVEQLLALADFLILKHLSGEAPLVHGDIYHISQQDELRITHSAPTEAMPDGAIRVSIERRLRIATAPPPRTALGRGASGQLRPN